MADLPEDNSTTAIFEGRPFYGATFSGAFETLSDVDAIKVTLTAGITYEFYGHADTADSDAVLTLVDSIGNFLAFDNDSGVDANAILTYTPSTTGTYLVQVNEFFGDLGTYSIDVAAATAADHLLTGGADTYTGATDERILAGLGNDTIDVGAGRDALGEQGDDGLTGNAFTNFLAGGRGNDTIHGGGGNDSLFGDAGDDVVYGGDGADLIYGGDGADVLVGETGNNQVHGGAGDDQVSGGSNNDTLYGDDGADTLAGALGADKLDGGAGADYMEGGDDNDTYAVDDTGDVVDETGATGADTVLSSISFSLVDDGTHVKGDVERLTLTGSADIDGTGNTLDNILTGNAGDNHLSGLDGKDTISGGKGDDVITGGGGNDLLTGGAGGADTFVFTSTADSYKAIGHRDVIEDFSETDGDKIDVSAIDADTTAAGTQHFDFIGTAGFSRHAGELRYAAINGDAYVYGDTNGDGKDDFSIQFHGVSSLQGSDFIL